MSDPVTYITLDDSDYTRNGARVQRGICMQMTTRPQTGPLKPFRLKIEPKIAKHFMILDVRVGNRSQTPQTVRIPATQFMWGEGGGFDCETIQMAMDFVMVVEPITDKAPPFTATWACRQVEYVGPNQYAVSVGGWRGPHGERWPAPMGAREHNDMADRRWSEIVRTMRDAAGKVADVAKEAVKEKIAEVVDKAIDVREKASATFQELAQRGKRKPQLPPAKADTPAGFGWDPYDGD